MPNLVADFLELCKNLERKIEKLEARIEELETENKVLKVENAELKERLGLNSKNSSIPSSKELYKIKKDKPKSEGILEVSQDMKVIGELKWMRMKW